MRLAIFVDGANLFYCQRDVLGWWIDWQRFIDYYRRSHRVVIARYYRALKGPPGDGDEVAFGRALTASGYDICEKPLKEVFDKDGGQFIRKGNLDVELALDAYDFADRYDHCLLVSGDGDFVALVNRLRQKGKIVTVASTRGSVAHELREAAAMSFLDLKQYRPKFERKILNPQNAVVPASDRGTPALRKQTRPVVRTPPGTIPIHGSVSVESPYKVGDQFPAIVRQVTEAGIVVVDQAGMTAFMAKSHLKLSVPDSNLAAVVQAGDECIARVIELRPGRTRAALMVELASSEYSQVLEDRLGNPGAQPAGRDSLCE